MPLKGYRIYRSDTAQLSIESKSTFAYTAELKDQLQTKLDNARIPSAGDDAETSLINEPIRRIPLRVIERIKELGTKLRVHPVSYLRILHQCDIKVVDARPNDGCAAVPKRIGDWRWMHSVLKNDPTSVCRAITVGCKLNRALSVPLEKTSPLNFTVKGSPDCTV